MPNFVTIADAAERLRVNERTIRNYIASGALRAYRVGGHLIRIDLDDLAGLYRPVNGDG